MNRRYLITGGAGFIGSAVVRHLIATTSHDILVVDKLTYAGNPANLATVAGDARFALLQADICDARKMVETFAAFQPTNVMHLAAESHVDRSIDRPSAFIETNVIGTFTLLETSLAYWRELAPSARERFRFHHISTDEVFGALGTEGTFVETTAYSPNSPYSASKAAADHLARAWYHTYGLPVVVSNCSNNYGPYHFPEKLIPLVVLNALEGKPIPVYGRGDHVRDWLYVEDHARALQLISENARPGQSYNVGGNGERSNLEVVQSICRILDEIVPDTSGGSRQRLICFVEDRPGHDWRYAVDASKIRRELGWEPSESFETGLDKTVRWYLQNKAWWQRIRSGIYQGERLGVVV